MFFRIPNLAPTQFDPGLQIYNPGQGGPASHPREQITQPRIYPTVFGVGLYGMGAMPRQVFQPTPTINVNQVAGIPQTLLIPGLQKKGF